VTAKAVFASQTFAVYVTGPDLRELCRKGDLRCDLFFGEKRAEPDSVLVDLNSLAWSYLADAVAAERAAIDAGLAKLPPRPDTRAADRRRKRERLHD